MTLLIDRIAIDINIPKDARLHGIVLHITTDAAVAA